MAKLFIVVPVVALAVIDAPVAAGVAAPIARSKLCKINSVRALEQAVRNLLQHRNNGPLLICSTPRGPCENVRSRPGTFGGTNLTTAQQAYGARYTT